MHRLKPAVVVFLLVFFHLFWPVQASAQDPAGLEQGIKPYGAYDGGNIDSVSMVNGGLTLHIPLVSIPQRGGKLSMTFSLGYNTPSLLPQSHVYCPNLNELSACYPDDTVYEFEMSPRQFAGPLSSASFGIQIVPDFYPVLYPNLRTVSAPYCNTSGATPPPGGCPGTLALVDYVLTEADGANHHLGPTQAGQGNRWLAKDATGFTLDLATSTYIDKAGIQYQGASTQVDPTSNVLMSSICCGSPNVIEDPNGNRITTNFAPSTIPGDAAGTTYPSGWTDTMGRFVPLPVANTGTGATTSTSTTNCTGPVTNISAYLWTIPGPNGATSQFTVCYASFPYTAPQIPICIQSPSLCSQYQTFPTATVQIQSIVLPNQTSWIFAYNTSGLLSQVTFPTGGTISYTWGINAACSGPLYWAVFPLYHYFVASRTIVDSSGSHTWTYSGMPFTSDTGTPQGTLGGESIVTDPVGNDAVHTVSNVGAVCTNLYETELDQYSGSHSSGTLLRTTKTAYSSIPDPTPFDFSWAGVPAMNVVPQSITTTDVPSGLTTQTTKAYDSGVPLLNLGVSAIFGDVTQENDYDFGNGTPGTLLRQTNTAYMAISGPNAASYLANNMLSLPYTTQVCDGSQSQYELTQYNYDENSLALSGLSGTATLDGAPSDSPYFGNNTSTQKWLSSGTGQCQAGATVGSGSAVTSRRTYFDTGLPSVAYDPLNHPTQYFYSMAYQAAYPTQIMNATGQSEFYQYDLNLGAKTRVIDANNQPTGYTYDVLGRLTNVQSPDGGNLSYCYSDLGLPLCQGAQNAPSVLMTKLQSGSSSGPSWPVTQPSDGSSQIIEADVDGLGRKIRVLSLSDPYGTDEVDTTYDGLGRVQSVSNPYDSTSDPTFGVTSYRYDALSRKTYQCQSDNAPTTSNACVPNNSYLQWVYSGSSVTSYDETGRQAQHTSDGLGRLTKVLEQDGTTNSSATPSVETDYSYDPLGNLLTVMQNGLPGEGARGRSFSYDSLSRLSTSTNPETGSIRYSYDLDGDLIQRTTQDPNLASGATTLGYCYDNLNRVQFKFYGSPNCMSPSSAVAAYQYDTSSISGAENTVGRLTNEESLIGGTVVSQRSPFDYDPMGRLKQEQQCPYGSCATPYLLQNFYDLAGNLIESNNGITGANAVYLASGYDGTGRLSNLNSSAIGNTPALTLFQAVAQSGVNPYSAAGLTNAQLGVDPTGSKVALSLARTYDNRLRLVSETDQGELQTSPASGSSGTITIAGIEQSIPASTYSAASITVTGAEGSHQVCVTTNRSPAPGKPPVPVTTCSTVYDTGTLAVAFPTVGFTATAPYEEGTTDTTLAAALAQSLNSANAGVNSPVTATSSAGVNCSGCGVVTMTSVQPGQASNYAFSISNGADFDGSGSGSAMTGGLTAAFDTGTITVNVTGLPPMPVNWGQGDSPTTVVSNVINTINTAASGVLHASSNGNGTILVNSLQTGSITNWSMTASFVDTATEFSQPSFSVLAVGLSGGTNAVLQNGTVYGFNLAGTYAANGNLLGYTDTLMGTWGFGYDNLNRLIAGRASAGTFQGDADCFSYDSFGNRLSATFSTNPCPTDGPSLPSPAKNQVSGLGYSAGGNVVGDGLNNYLYDSENRVCAVQGAQGGGLTGYVYDAEGSRVAKGTLTSFSCPNGSNFTPTEEFLLGQGGEQLSVLDGQGNWQRTNVYAGGRLLATYDSGGVHYQLSDWLGTKRVQMNALGVAEENCTSLPFGDQLSCSGPDPSQLHFTGKFHDSESGLDYFGARYYASTVGRMMSPDWSAKAEPVPYAKLADPQTLNLYAYVGNNPLSWTDSTGHYLDKCGAGDKKCEKGVDKFEKQRQKDLKSKHAEVRNAAAAWGNRGEDNHINVTFKPQAQVDQDSGLALSPGEHVGAMVTPGATGDHTPSIEAEFSESAGGSDLGQTIAHEGSHIEDDMGFLNSYNPATGQYEHGRNFTHFTTEFGAYGTGGLVKPYPNFPSGPSGNQQRTDFINKYYPCPQCLVFDPRVYPQ